MFGPDPKSSAIVLPVKPLHAMYAEPARHYIERHGGTVRTGAAATIHVERDAATSVLSGAEGWSVGAVISSVPWFALSSVFTGDTASLEPLFRRSNAMESSPIVTVNLWLDRPVIDEPFVGLPGRAMQWVFDKQRVSGGAGGYVSLVSSGAASFNSLNGLAGRSNPQLIATAYEELLDALPTMRAARLMRASVIREPKATFSLAPGQPIRPTTETPIRGLFLAGDWIDTGLPATIESAVRSGHRAAGAVLRHSSR